MPPRLHVAMLGRFELWEEQSSEKGEKRRKLPLPATTKSQSLLAYLLIHRESSHSRDSLAEIFWPGRPTQRARRSLSTALWRIRRCLAPIELLQCDRQLVRVSLPEAVSLDVETFASAVKQAEDVEGLNQALELYQGDFLPGFYDEWALRQREWLQALYQDSLLRLMQQRQVRGEMYEALEIALRALQVDACNEAAHRTAMQAYWRLGQRAAALAQYDRCRETLAREMAAEPMPETTALYHSFLGSQEPIGDSPMETGPKIASHSLAASPPSRAIAPELPPLVGRDEIMLRLLSEWNKTVLGSGGLIFLNGEAGIGKTRLLTTLAREAQQRQGVVISVQCFEYERGEPYGALVEILRKAAAIDGESIIQHISSWQLANLAKLYPELYRFLPVDAHYMAATEAEQKHLLSALVRFLGRLARNSPLLLLMDDLQWAHESVLAWLPMLASEASQGPLLMVGAYRIEEVAPGDLLARIIANLISQKQAQLISLPRLTPAHLAQWLRGLDEDEIARIHRHTEGNPFFILETLRTLMEQGLVQRMNGGYQIVQEDVALPLPESVRQAVSARLAGLSPLARQGLGVAAVIGRMFDLDVWEQVWGVAEEDALEALDELLNARLLQGGRTDFARDYEFEHHLVRETAYQAIPKRRRQQLHIHTAHALKKLRGGEPGLSAEIAFHYLRAGEKELARPWLLLAGDQAVEAAATGEALNFYKRALMDFPKDEPHRFERAVLERKIGEVHFRRGEHEQAEQHFLAALMLLNRPFPNPGFPLHRAVTAALSRQSAHRIIPGIARVAPVSATPALREEVTNYTSLGWIYSLQSRYEEYLLVSLRALNQSEDAGYARGIAAAATALGFAADFMAQFGLADHFHRRAQAVADDLDQPADIGFVAFGRAYHAYLLGDEKTMLAQAQLAADKFSQVRDAHRWTLSRLLQAYVLAYRGRLNEVQEIGEALIKAGMELQDATAACAGECLMGLAGRWRGEWEAAIKHYRSAAELARAIPDYMSLVENLSGQARCLLRLGNWAQADAALNQAQEIVSQQDVKGDALGKFSVARFETALWAAEHPPHAQSDWPAQAKQAMSAARKQAKAFRPIEPETWRLCGRYEWLDGRSDAARRWWEKSMARAKTLNHPLDWAVTALEMGLRMDAASMRAQGRARLEDTEAAGEIVFLHTCATRHSDV